MINFLKLHIFLFYGAYSGVLVFNTVYVRRYTDASYHELGILMMICFLSGASIKPLVCSLADRYRSYKFCLMANLTIMLVCTIPFTLLPFQPKLFFKEPQLRFNWYLVSFFTFIFHTGVANVITLDDVFIVHRCMNSAKGEYFGQYRYMGSLGGAASSLCLAFLENYTKLPYLSLPMLISCLLLLLDLVCATKLTNIDTHRPALLSLAISNECLKIGEQVVAPLPKIGSGSINPRASSLSSSGSKETISRISLMEQFRLLAHLNRYDNFNLLKYLMGLIVLGASAMVHYVFFMESFSQLLKTRELSSLFFILSSLVQISTGLGETCSLLWCSQKTFRSLGRDAVLILCLLMSCVRYSINGFLMDKLNVWIIAALDFQTGFLWGFIYNMMVDTAASYLSILDASLLMDIEPQNKSEIDLVSYLDDLKSQHSIESIRFALKATIQSIFSGACEGIGFALGPLLAGLWLNPEGGSITGLFKSLVIAHIVVIALVLVVEYGFIRWTFDSATKTDSKPDVSKKKEDVDR